MPTYQYECRNCGHQLEELQSFSDPLLLCCPKCQKDSLARVLGGGGGLIFKGTGFYGTDYKKSRTSPESTPKPAEKTEKKVETSTSPATPAESKPAGESKTPPPKKD